MNDEAGRLVHHQNVLVLEDHADGYVLERESFLGKLGLDELPVSDLIRRRNFLTVYEQVTFSDEALHEAAAAPETSGGEPVETLPSFRRFCPEALGVHPLGETAGQDPTHFFSLEAPDDHGLGPGRRTPDHGHARGGDAQ